MSYGRKPYFIFECECGGGDDHPAETRHVVFDFHTVVEWDALAQFVASANTSNRYGDDSSLFRLIDRGLELRPELAADQDIDWIGNR